MSTSSLASLESASSGYGSNDGKSVTSSTSVTSFSSIESTSSFPDGDLMTSTGSMNDDEVVDFHDETSSSLSSPLRAISFSSPSLCSVTMRESFLFHLRNSDDDDEGKGGEEEDGVEDEDDAEEDDGDDDGIHTILFSPTCRHAETSHSSRNNLNDKDRRYGSIELKVERSRQKIVVQVNSAQNLNPLTTDSCNSYVHVRLTHMQGHVLKKFRTKTIFNTFDPHFNESISFHLPEQWNDYKMMIHTTIYNENPIISDEELGHVEITLPNKLYYVQECQTYLDQPANYSKYLLHHNEKSRLTDFHSHLVTSSSAGVLVSIPFYPVPTVLHCNFVLNFGVKLWELLPFGNV
ncbi:hypothetical protein HELRODRAFT_172402 [Helobdella robusta]|uniref:C2 domain-containing protein n=1 Tax=Helobdella robusta TaxID=6412 RepID=T1F594_HELRO|nr:hypothetical protein HELRODRAFT_172396 [Helobdella robusta]XP_009017306.1 hypothetical protein HELRODRAFT_172402 [Helobdella robusta]ESO04721.1 hypothetical protein HELRODRAFT_172396 [Helobdella robusta]ESO04727.1 hypothetical protein HELRODRAFT_172402 [Helobdella robusta]